MIELPPRETLIETGDGHVIAVSTVNGRVCLDWIGPRHAELDEEAALTLGYVLRGYVNLTRLADRRP